MHHRVAVVVMAQRLVRRQPDRHRLVAAVHRDQVDVHVDQQVALGGPLVDLDVLAGVGQADVQQVVAVLGVVVGEPVGPEGQEDPLADGPPDLGGRSSGGAARWRR